MRLFTLFSAGCVAIASVLLISCGADKPRGNNGTPEEMTPQPMTRTSPGNTDGGSQAASGSANERGKQVFRQYCTTCHMANGQGLSGVYPPLSGSDFLKDKPKTIAAIANGLSGKITVKGKEYNNTMPPIPGTYSNADVASVITYVVATFGGGSWTATEAEVAAVRKK